MAIIRFLSEDGVDFLTGQLIDLISTKIDANRVTTVSSTSTNNNSPGTLAVYTFVTGLLADVVKVAYVVIEDGDPLPTAPASGDEGKFHLWRDNTTDKWGVYVYYDGWKFLTDFAADITGFWAKTELDALSNARIQEIIDGHLTP